MIYKLTLKDLRKEGDLYYVADVASVDGSGWVSKKEAKEIIDMLNEQAILAQDLNGMALDPIEDWYDDYYTDDMP